MTVTEQPLLGYATRLLKMWKELEYIDSKS